MNTVRNDRRDAARSALTVLVVVGSILLFPLLAGGEALGPSEESLFNEANQAYNGNDFATAADRYKQLLDMGQESGEVLYNLGNCYFRMDELGRALVAYERARRSMPRNRNLLGNIALAEAKATDAITPPKLLAVIRRLFSWHYMLDARETSQLALAANAVFWVSLCVLTVTKKRFAKAAVVLFGLILILSGCSYALKEVGRRGLGNAVVTVGEAEVRTGPGDYAVTFNLHDGARLKLVEARDGWYEIRLADGKRGWIETDKVERI